MRKKTLIYYSHTCHSYTGRDRALWNYYDNGSKWKISFNERGEVVKEKLINSNVHPKRVREARKRSRSILYLND